MKCDHEGNVHWGSCLNNASNRDYFVGWYMQSILDLRSDLS